MYITEEAAEIASQYFYEMGLNSDGIRILAEELGPDEFSEFVEDIICSYTISEARSGGAPRGRQTQKTQKIVDGKKQPLLHFSDPEARKGSALPTARKDLKAAREKFYAKKTRGSSQEGGVRGFLGGTENAKRQQRISQLRAKTGRTSAPETTPQPQVRGQRRAPATGSRLTGTLASKGEAPKPFRSRTLQLPTRQSEYTRGSVRSTPRSESPATSDRSTKIMRGLKKSTTPPPTTPARSTALEAAKKDQGSQKSTPTQRKKSVLDALAGQVLKGIERHNRAWQSPGAQEFRKKASRAGRLAGNVAKDIEAAALATGATVAKDVLEFKEDFELWVNELLDEGYDLSEYTWDDMVEIYEENISYMAEGNQLYGKLISHLIHEGYANSIDGAQAIAENMSDSWISAIIN